MWLYAEKDIFQHIHFNWNPIIMAIVTSASVSCVNPQTAGVPYTEQNHLHGQRREFCIRNNAQKTKQNDVKTILFSLAYLAPIKLPFV